MRRATVSATLLFALAVSSPSPAIAQNGSWNVAVPSPAAASLGRFGEIPVSLFTGEPEISIPLYTVRGRTLELPITLRYRASGLRVEDIGSWVGMGWSLEAGGVITRSLRGLPDEWGIGYYNTGTTLFTTQNWPTPSYDLLHSVVNGWADTEPDQFYFNFAGNSGEFAIGPTGSSLNSRTVRTAPYRNWDIRPTFTGDTIVGWVVKTEDGSRYTFGAPEMHTDYTQVVNSALAGHRFASAWFLTGIHAPGGDSITIRYTPYEVDHNFGTSGERHDATTYPGCIAGELLIRTRNHIVEQRLTTISSAADSLTFHADSLRLDALSSGITHDSLQPQEPRLDSITVRTPAGVVRRRFWFQYDYSIGEATNKRLTLKNVYERDRNGASLPPYSFTYAGPTLPGRASYAVDHWGYYNGRTGNTTLIPPGRSPTYLGGHSYGGADRLPDSAYTHAGILTRVTYPTGGYNEFVYEPNDFSGALSAGVLTDSGPPQSVGVNADAQHPGPNSTTFTVGGFDTVTVYLSLYISNPPGSCTSCPYGYSDYWGYYYQSRTDSIRVPPGTPRTLTVQTGGYPTIVVLTANWRDRIYVTKKTGGGVRIAQLRTVDGMGNTTIHRYDYRLPADTARSSGYIDAIPQYDWVYQGWPGPPLNPPLPQCEFYARSVTPGEVILGSSTPVRYGYVTVLNGANGEFGRERHTFHFFDVPPEYMGGGNWPYHRRTSFYWRWGQDDLIEQYDSAGRRQQTVGSTWAFPDSAQTSRDFRGISVNAFPIGGMHYTWSMYRVLSRWKYQATETITAYDTAGVASFPTSRTFVYGNASHAQLTEVDETNSDGTQRITRMRYPADYAVGYGDSTAAALTAMHDTAAASVHMPGVVIERWVSQRVGGTEQVLQGELTTYKLFGVGLYLPYQRFILNYPSPLP